MKKKALLAIFILTVLSIAFSQQKVREKDLSFKYRDWLKLTTYVILPQEKEVFLQIDNDRDRDLFIESFWRQRDPTPGTPENEYKDELIKRFNYANKEFHKGAPRDGWMTDMGRFYIILGPPNSKEEFEMRTDVYPCRIWYYFGDTAKGLPTYFALVFFKRGGTGEYKLYDPVADGPISLLIDKRDVDYTDSYAVYEKIKETAPTLAPLTLSMIPGDNVLAYESTLRSAFILQSILESPKKDVNASYAKHFLDFKGVVSTEYLTNFVECEATIALLQDPLLGIPFLHYSVAPKTFSVDYFEPKDQHYCNYSVDVSLRKGEEIFYQDSKEFPFYFAPADAPAIKANGIAVQDSFPVIPGSYKFIILLKNSVGKEFSVVEKDITYDGSIGVPGIFGVVLGYKMEEARTEVHMPFSVADRRLSVDSKNTYKAEEEICFFTSLVNITPDLWQRGELKVEIKGLSGNSPSRKSFSLRLSSLPFHPQANLSSSFAAADLAPDYYEMKFQLADGEGKILDAKPANFIITPDKLPGRPIAVFKTFPLASSYLYWYIIADQFDKTGDQENAELHYRRAYDAAPEYHDGIVSLAEFMVRRQRYDDALKMAERLAGKPKFVFHLHLIKGQALMGRGQFSEAVDELLEANKIYDSDTRVLNALGFCLDKTGDRNAALKALNASLRLNPDQPGVKKLVEEISKK